MTADLNTSGIDAPPSPGIWVLPDAGLTVFHGHEGTPRLFHYFLPRLIAQGKCVLCLDGGNRFDPLLIARFAREHGQQSSVFNQRLRVARAFTCFQLTELLERLPRLLRTFPAQIAMVTALPDLYFDEDVCEREAIASFERALQALKAAEQCSLAVAVFTGATSSHSPRRSFLQRLILGANHVFRFEEQENTSHALEFAEQRRFSSSGVKIPEENVTLMPRLKARPTNTYTSSANCLTNEKNARVLHKA